MVGDAQGTVTLGFEPRGLFAEPDATALRRFRRRLESGPLPDARTRRRLIVDTAIRIVLGAVLFVPLFVVAVIYIPVAQAMPVGAVVAFAVLLLFVGAAVAYLLWPIRLKWRAMRPWRRWFRLSTFAEDNGLDYYPESTSIPAGLMFWQGKQRRVIDTFVARDGSFAMGTFTFMAEGGSRTRDPKYSFLRIALPRPVPHLVLLSVARRGLRGYSSVGLAFAESQRVRLEGDFDKYFAVYAPDGYGADARYILTPDFMVRLIDNAKDFDLEFVDNHLYVYSATVWDPERLATWAWTRSFAEIIGTAAHRRTGRFSDDRSPAPGYTVAPQGRRLKLGVPLAAALIPVGWIVFQIIRAILQANT